VILRLIRGRADRTRLEALRDELRSQLAPRTGTSEWPVRWHLGVRAVADAAAGAADESGDESVEILLLALWDSAEAVTAADAARTTAWHLARPYVSGPVAEHFEVDDTLLRRTGQEPVAIRVATGRFSSPGADIEMQQLLRERLPTIGDEVCEAYVGRRFAGAAIEITFVSAWQRLPQDRRLEESFWPDIALRYDAFTVEVYEAVG
jgi:hypothetical protein